MAINKKYSVLGIIVLVLALAIAGYMMYNKPHRDIAKSESDFVIPATQLYQEYSTEETNANTKYLDKIIKVSGTVKNINETGVGEISVSLESGDVMGGVLCGFSGENSKAAENLKPGDTITLKGVCTGMLLDVVLNKCVLVTN